MTTSEITPAIPQAPVETRRPLARKAARGMTLLEIMVVITIIGVVMGIVAFAVLPQLDQAKVDATRLSMKNVESAAKLYYMRNNKWPSSMEQISQGLENPNDGWGNKFTLSTEGGKFVVISNGKDGIAGTADDLRSDQPDNPQAQQ